MQIPSGTITILDNILDDVKNQLVSLQANYLAEVGYYWQGLATHGQTSGNTIPEDGNDSTCDFTRKPINLNAKDWNEMGLVLAAALPLCLEVYNYHGPSGKGYVIIGQLRYNTILHRRMINVGPDTLSDRDWMEYPDS